jgi:hypothetical protein
MMHMSLFSHSNSKKNNAELIAVYDIGSASVGVALVLIVPQKKPNIIYAVREDMNFLHAPNAQRMGQVMYETLRLVGEDILRKGMPHLRFTKFGNLTVSRAHITFASPWYASQTRMVHKSYDHPKNIDMIDIISSVEKERDMFMKDEEVFLHIGKGENILIEERVIGVQVNGYETAHPENMHGRTLDITTIFSVAPHEMVRSVTDEIKRVFPSCDSTLNTFPLVAFDALRNKKGVLDHFFFVDISGEVTDVSFIYEGKLVETVTFPIGKKTIVRAIVEDLKTSEEDVMALLELVTTEEGVVGARKKSVDTAVMAMRDVWSRAYQHACVDVSDVYPIPQTVFFTSDVDSEDFFASMIRDELSTWGLGKRESVVQAVNTQFLYEQCAVSRDSIRDPFLMLEAVFAQSVHD